MYIEGHLCLEAHEHDALLPLQPDVLGPLHEAREVALGLDVATEAVVPGSLLKERIPRALQKKLVTITLMITITNIIEIKIEIMFTSKNNKINYVKAFRATFWSSSSCRPTAPRAASCLSSPPSPWLRFD